MCKKEIIIKMKIIVDEIVSVFRKFSGVGEKTAQRYTYELLEMNKETRENLIEQIKKMETIKRCSNCNNYTLNDICDFCLDDNRKTDTLIIVEKAKNIDKIEVVTNGQFQYYVLGGVIDPLCNVTSKDLYFDKLFERINNDSIKEIILVLPSTSEGELTSAFIRKKLINNDLIITKLAQGIPMGSSLEYLDEITLLKSLNTRQEY